MSHIEMTVPGHTCEGTYIMKRSHVDEATYLWQSSLGVRILQGDFSLFRQERTYQYPVSRGVLDEWIQS